MPQKQIQDWTISMTPRDDSGVDFDQLAREQIAANDPDQLDGPAWDLDRTLDDANPEGEGDDD
jgi:hypothetical protein